MLKKLRCKRKILMFQLFLLLLLGFTLCEAEQSSKGMELQEKEEQKDKMHIGKLFRKNPK